MRLKPKTIRRLTLAGAVVVLTIGVAVALLFVRTAQSQAIADRLRAQGMAAHEAGEHFEALSELGRYLRRVPEDPDALLAYARSREAIEEADGRHVLESIGVLQRYLVLRPHDRDSKLELLKLYNKAGYFPEARQAAVELRPDKLDEVGPAHQQVLREEAVALLGAGRHDDLAPVLDRLLTIAPTSVEAWLLRIELAARQDDLASADEHVDAVASEHLDEDHATLLRALVLLRQGDERARALAEAMLSEVVAAGDTLDADALRVLAVALDRVGRHESALVALRRAARADDFDARLLLCRRLYQRGDIEALDKELADLDWSDPQTSALLAGLDAVVAIEAGDLDEARAIRDALAARKADFRAEAWTIVIEQAIAAERTTASERTAALRKATQADPHEPIIRALLADALSASGRHDDAAAEWKRVVESPGSIGWPAARAHLAESTLRTGDVVGALDAAREAVLSAPDNVLANVVWIETETAALASGAETSIDPERFVTHCEQLWDALLALDDDEAGGELLERLAAARIGALAELGRAEQAREAIARLADGGVVSPALIERLIAIDNRESLGAASVIAELAAEADPKSPSAVMARALELASRGQVQQGLELIEHASWADQAAQEAWVLARARYLSRVDHDDALDAWRLAAERFPQSALVQRAVLSSDEAAKDRPLIEGAIERYEQLTEEPVSNDAVVALARARATLASSENDRDWEEAIASLRRLTADKPTLLDAKLLLASAYLAKPAQDRAANLRAALEQLQAALALAPRSAPVTLELARVLDELGQTPQSLELLQRLAESPTASRDQRVRAAEMLAQAGKPGVALRALEQMLDESEDLEPVALVLPLGEVALAARDQRATERAVGALANNELTTPSDVVRAATILHRAGAPEEAQHTLESLDSLTAGPGDTHRWRARFWERVSEHDKAIQHHRLAFRESPTREIAADLASLLLITGADQEARDLISKSLESASSERSVLIRIIADALADPDLPNDVARLIRSKARSTDPAQAEAMVRDLTRATGNAKLDDAASLLEISDRHGRLPGVRAFVARRLASLGGTHAEDALPLAREAMRQSPHDARPARLAAEILLRQRRWEEMLDVSREWARRSGGADPEAQVAIAQALLNLGKHVDATRALSALVEEIDADGVTSVQLAALNVQAGALIAAGRTGEAESLLEPLVRSSLEVRVRVWLPLAAQVLRDPQVARRWIDTAASLIGPDAHAERFAVATAYAALASRSSGSERDSLAVVAQRTLDPLLAEGGPLEPQARETAAKLLHLQGDLEAAEQEYRRAIDLNEELPESRNNLAGILIENGLAQEALLHARRAVHLTDAGVPAFLDTLADALELAISANAEAATSAAATAMEQELIQTLSALADVQSGAPEALGRLAQAAEAAGRYDLAIESYRRLVASDGAASSIAAAARNNLAYLLLSHQDDEASMQEAYLLAQEATSLAQKPAFLDTLGHACLATGRVEEAESAFQRALALEPGKVSSLLGLGRALAETDDLAGAADVLKSLAESVAAGAELTAAQAREYEALRASVYGGS